MRKPDGKDEKSDSGSGCTSQEPAKTPEDRKRLSMSRGFLTGGGGSGRWPKGQRLPYAGCYAVTDCPELRGGGMRRGMLGEWKLETVPPQAPVTQLEVGGACMLSCAWTDYENILHGLDWLCGMGSEVQL